MKRSHYPDFFWALIFFALKNFVKTAEGLKSGVKGNIQHFGIGCLEKGFGMSDTVLLEKATDRDSKILFKKSHGVIGVKAGRTSDILQMDVSIEVSADEDRHLYCGSGKHAT